MFERLSSLRTRIMLLVLLVILPTIGLAASIASAERQHEIARAQENALYLAQVISDEEELFIQNTRQLLITLAQNPKTWQADRVCQRMMAGLLEEYTGYLNLGTADLEGNINCSALPLSTPVNIADRNYFRQALKEGSFAVGEYQVGRVTGKASINFGYPVLDDSGRPQAVVFAALDLSRPSHVKSEIQSLLPPGSIFTRVDSKGKIITRLPDGDPWLGRLSPELSTLGTQRTPGVHRARDAAGVPHLYAVIQSEDDPFVDQISVILSIPEETAFQHINRMFLIEILGLGVIALAMLSLARVGSDWYILRRVKALIEATNRLAHGDLGARSGLDYGTGELSQLARNFDQMASSLELREAQLHQAEVKYRSLVEQIPAMVYVAALDKNSTRLYVSPQIDPLLGFTSEEWLADPEFWVKQLHPEDRERILAEVVRSHESGEPFRGEYRLLHRDGHPVWLHDDSVLIRDEAGSPLFLQGVMFDITARKTAEEKQNALLQGIPDLVLLVSQEGIVLDYNVNQVSQLWFHPDEFLGRNVSEIAPVEMRQAGKEAIQQAIYTRQVQIREFELLAGDQNLYWEARMVPCGEDKAFIIARDITERKQAEEALLHYTERLKAQHEIDQAILAAQTPQEIVNAALSRLRRLVPCQRISVMMFDFAAGEVEIFAAEVDGRTSLETGKRFPLAEILQVVHSAQTGQVYDIEDLEALEPLPPVEQTLLFEGIHSVIIIPLRAHGDLIGTLNLGSEQIGAFSEAQAAIAREVADSLAIAIQDARLQEAERRRRQEAETLQAVTAALNTSLHLDQVLDLILEHLARVISYDSASVLLPKGKQMQITAGRGSATLKRLVGKDIFFADGLHQEIRQTRRPVILADAQADDRFEKVAGFEYIRGWMGVPLLYEGNTIGFLTLDSSRVGAYGEAEARLAQAFANQAAIAIENARLFAETERRLQHLAALREVDLTISSSLDLRFTLDVLLNQVITQLHVNAACVILLNPYTWTMEYAAGLGFRSPAIKESRISLGEGLAGRAALERRIISSPDLSEKEHEFIRSKLLAGEGFVSNFAVPLVIKGQVKGVLDVFHRSRLEPTLEWLSFLEALAGQAAIAIDSAQLFDDLQHSNIELIQAYNTTIEGWSRALDLRDKETEGHTQRVTEMAVRLAQAMGMAESDLVHVRRGALLHDIGKMGIPDNILLKPGALNEEEWVIMRKHPIYAYELLSPIVYLRPALDIPYCHHEKWDGSGYPRGLKGEQIPLAARIFALVDVWDALCSDRPYRSAWPEKKALAYIHEQRGQHFDPQVVDAFLKMRE